MWFLLELEMFSVTSGSGTKYEAVKSCLMCLNSYCQNHLEQHESFFKERDTIWLKPLDDCRRWSARNMRSSLRFSAALIRNVYVYCVRWMNIKTTTLYQLQHRGQRNRYLTPDTDEILLTLVSYVFISAPILTAYSIHTAHDSRN